MNIKNKSKKHIAPVTAITVAALFSIYLLSAYVFHFFPFASQPASVSDTIKQNSGAQSPDNPITQSSTGLPDNSGSTTTEDVPETDSQQVSITAQTQDNGYVSTTAAVSGSGTCVFLYTNPDDKPVTSQTDATNNMCQSSVRETEFSKLGEWKLKVTFYNNGQKVETIKSVNIQ